MKGLALLRSGKTAESEALMKEIMEAKPADDPTLQAMTICYREMQKRKNSSKNDFTLFITFLSSLVLIWVAIDQGKIINWSKTILDFESFFIFI